MLQKIRIFLRYALSWIVVIACIWVIGYVLYPLLVEKYNSMALRKYQNASGEITIQVPTEGQTQVDKIADGASQILSTKTNNFLAILREIFSNNKPKKEIIYQKDEANGTYRAR